MALRALTEAWSLARRIDELLQLQAQVRAALDIVGDRLDKHEDRMIRLEAEKAQLVSEARSAATAASTTIASSIISDLVTRVTRLEGRTDQIESRQLSPTQRQD